MGKRDDWETMVMLVFGAIVAATLLYLEWRNARNARRLHHLRSVPVIGRDLVLLRGLKQAEDRELETNERLVTLPLGRHPLSRAPYDQRLST